MPFDAQEIFANLAEKEKLKGHHSPEGRAIRVLSRALSGWSSPDLSVRDVIVLCDQAVEEWLKVRLRRSPWSAQALPALIQDALKNNVITRLEAARLQKVRHLRSALRDGGISKRHVETTLEFCIELIEKRW
ncbi:MAG TPA: hypothetical protein VGK57_12505 [Candidatus Binatia bacterium]